MSLCSSILQNKSILLFLCFLHNVLLSNWTAFGICLGLKAKRISSQKLYLSNDGRKTDWNAECAFSTIFLVDWCSTVERHWNFHHAQKQHTESQSVSSTFPVFIFVIFVRHEHSHYMIYILLQLYFWCLIKSLLTIF